MTTSGPGTVSIVFERGRTWTLDELPPRSIALDGAVSGAAFDNAHHRYSFDHHAGVLRHIALATCEQVRDALRVGLDPRGFTVFVNDIDGDTVTATWLLMRPELMRGPDTNRVCALVERIGRVDALGPAVGPALPLHRALEVGRGEEQSLALLLARIAMLDAWLASGAGLEPRDAAASSDMADAFWLGANGNVTHGRVAGMTGLYTVADVGVLHEPAVDGTRTFTVGKRSEFVDYDVPAFFARMNALEPGWGGGSTVGGAPRHADGRRSILSVEAVAAGLAAGRAHRSLKDP